MAQQNDYARDAATIDAPLPSGTLDATQAGSGGDEIESVNVKGSSVTLYFDEGSLTIQKAKGKTLTITDSFGDRGDYIFKRSTDEFESGLLEVAADNASELEQIVGDKNYSLGSIDLDIGSGTLSDPLKEATKKIIAASNGRRG